MKKRYDYSEAQPNPYARPRRLTIEIEDGVAWVRLDGVIVKLVVEADEAESKAEAERYVIELRRHFRQGGE